MFVYELWVRVVGHEMQWSRVACKSKFIHRTLSQKHSPFLRIPFASFTSSTSDVFLEIDFRGVAPRDAILES